MTTAATNDRVGKTLLPTLLHDINNATQLLVGLRAVLDLPGGDALFAGKANDLARTSERVHDLGFAMAVIATSSGADMLMTRRHARGLSILFELAVHSVERAAGGAIERTGDAPDLAPSAMDGWQPPWSVAAFVLAIHAHAEPAACRWEWLDGELVAHVDGALDAAEIESLQRVAPGLDVVVEPGRVVWSPPAEWLA